MLLKKESRGEEVRNLQQKLISLGYNMGLYGADGVFGEETHNAVIKLQREHGLSADGIVGPNTLAKLNSSRISQNLKIGSRGQDVTMVQQKLTSLGYSCGNYGVDGVFGQGTYDAVVRFQKSYGLIIDGIVGKATIETLNKRIQGCSNNNSIKTFINVAKNELEKGVHEKNGDNITPYGEWYGMNGQPWCAMFVSWCANKSGILGTIIPKYAYCPTGVDWYKNCNRYKKRSTGYMPKEGDIIFFLRGSEIGHTGIVIYCNSKERFIYTIEGNSNNAVRKKKYDLSDSSIDGYGIN